MTRKYEEKLSAEIITGNYELVYCVAQVCELKGYWRIQKQKNSP